MKKVLLIIASEDYQPVEYGEPKRILEKAGHNVITVSDKTGEVAAQDGSTAIVELLLSDVKITDADALFFIGGSGALKHLDNENSYELLRAWQKTGKPYGAICISPRILAKAGVLENKKATGWDGDGGLAGIFKQYGVEYARENVVADDSVVTANGPAAAEEFGRTILKILNKY